MKNWKVYFTQPGYDSKLVYDGPAESFKQAIRLSGIFLHTVVDDLEFDGTSFTYSINGSIFSTKPKMFLVAKAGRYEGMHPLVDRPAIITLHRDVSVWSGFAKDLKSAIKQAKLPKARWEPACIALGCDATYAQVDRKTFYARYYKRNLRNCTISFK